MKPLGAALRDIRDDFKVIDDDVIAAATGLGIYYVFYYSFEFMFQPIQFEKQLSVRRARKADSKADGMVMESVTGGGSQTSTPSKDGLRNRKGVKSDEKDTGANEILGKKDD